MNTALIIALAVVAVIIIIVIIVVAVKMYNKDESSYDDGSSYDDSVGSTDSATPPDSSTQSGEVAPSADPNAPRAYYFHPMMNSDGGGWKYPTIKDGKSRVAWMKAKCDANRSKCVGFNTRSPAPKIFTSLKPRAQWTKQWPDDPEMGLYTVEPYL